MVDSTAQNSLTQMAEDIFNLTKMSWRERISSNSDRQDELTEAQFLTLDAISSAGTPQNIGYLHRTIGVLPAQMSRIVRSLERDFPKPLIQCRLNPDDKRKIDVSLTAAGKIAHTQFRDLRLQTTLQLLGRLDEQDRTDFTRICRRLRDLYAHPSATENH